MPRRAALAALCLLASAPLGAQTTSPSSPSAAPAPPTGKPLANVPIGPDYQPQDKDERGLWMTVAEDERLLQQSNFVIRDPALNAYVRGVFCRMVGDAQCAAVRIYLVRTTEFNASMAPNGMMIVNTGLLVRLQDEAQLAEILGHEYTHYRYRHVLQGFREARARSTEAVWLSFIPVIGTLAALGSYGQYFQFSRTMEAQADSESVPLMVNAGYDPQRAWRIWEQIRDEQDATALARQRKSRKDKDRSIWASHPPTAERLAALKGLADKAVVAGATDGRDRYRAALSNWWPQFIDDEIKRNDFGSTEFLLGMLARDGWTPALLYARGELYRARARPDDLKAAIGFYQQAIAAPAAPPEARRGLGLALLRSGAPSEGKAALRDYLTARPDASDKAMLAALATD